MIKASSLFYAIVISIIIAIISSALILFSYLSTIQFQDSFVVQRLNLNADSGINLLLSKQSLVDLNKKQVLDLYNEGMDSLELSRKSWGAHEVIISKAFFKTRQIIRVAETGFYPDSNNSYSLYLADQDKPLALCGKTVISGTAYLPKAGVKRAYIEGQNFTGNQLINGNIKTSGKVLPEFNKELIESIQNIFRNNFLSDTDSIVRTDNGLDSDTLDNSFANPTITFFSPSLINIAGSLYSGNIGIISGRQITITSEASLHDIIVCAPKILIKEGFRGNIQAFASDSIILEKNISLSYPSVLGIVMTDKSPLVSAVSTNEKDTIGGCIFSFRNNAEMQKQCGVIIRNKVIVTGQIFSNGYVDIQGIINGSLMCNKIILSTPSSVYENHLLNVTIDLNKRSRYYVATGLMEESQTKKVVKWLH